MVQHARGLRRDSSIPERVLWSMLRNRRMAGLKFRRQHPIGPFVADFYCEDARLVVELDGESHVGKGEQDVIRTRYLEKQGVRVVRFTIDELLSHRDVVAEAIVSAAAAARPPSP